MKTIHSNIYCRYYPLAHEECRKALLALGYDSFRIIGHKGSHTAEIYFFGSDEERFKNELLNNTLIGQYRKFYFSNSYSSLGFKNPYYNISYGSNK